ncbi:hypothetical protein ABQF34_29460 [Mycolicibacterium boenickei]
MSDSEPTNDVVTGSQAAAVVFYSAPESEALCAEPSEFLHPECEVVSDGGGGSGGSSGGAEPKPQSKPNGPEDKANPKPPKPKPKGQGNFSS